MTGLERVVEWLDSIAIPSRWECDALAAELAHCRALAAAEAELDAADQAWRDAEDERAQGAALDRYLLAVSERNAIRDGRP